MVILRSWRTEVRLWRFKLWSAAYLRIDPAAGKVSLHKTDHGSSILTNDFLEASSRLLCCAGSWFDCCHASQFSFYLLGICPYRSCEIRLFKGFLMNLLSFKLTLSLPITRPEKNCYQPTNQPTNQPELIETEPKVTLKTPTNQI